MARALQAAQGHPGARAGGWLGGESEAALPLPRTHAPYIPIWPAWLKAEAAYKTQKHLVSILENPRDRAALPAFPLGHCGSGRSRQMAAVLSRGRGPGVVGLGPLWGPQAREQPGSSRGSLGPMDAPLPGPCWPGAAPDAEGLARGLRPAPQAP